MARLASTSRFAGSDAETDARGYCRSLLEERGFSVEEQQFEYSQVPGRWGPSLVALLAAAAVWLGVHFATRHHQPLLGLIVDLGGLSLLSLLGYWVTRKGVLDFPFGRAVATNLVATRNAEESRPWLWLAAHVDSKSQTIPMIARVASAVAFTLASAGATLSMFVLAAFSIRNHPDRMLDVPSSFGPVATLFSWIAVTAATPIIFCFVRNESHGALDNASGVATVILVAEQIDPSRNVGIVITSAEELGLAGARYFAATEPTGEVAINCDTIDETGAFRCMASGMRIHRLDEAIDQAASNLGITTSGIPGRARRASLRLRPMIPGILADNMAFTDAGWESFTLSRGNIGTLGLVHTSKDVPDRVKGTGIAMAADFIAAIVQELG